MPNYEYSAWLTVRATDEEAAEERLAEASGMLNRTTTVTMKAWGDEGLREEIKNALEGDSNDAEHDALVSVAQILRIDYDPDLAS